MKKYNVAVIGYGNVANAHIAAINATSLAQVTTICSSRALDAAALSARHGCPLEVATDLTAVLARGEVDAVSICSYPYQHADHVVAAARAGKHVIVEKPIALAPGDVQGAVQAVEAAGVRACVCFEARFSSQLLTTKAVVDSGLLGTIHYGEVDYFHGIGPWSRQFRWNTREHGGGSSLLSAGCHALDALLLCMGGEVESVTSHATRSQSELFAPYEYPTTSVTVLRFKDGRLGKVASVIDCLQPYYFHTHLVGSEGSLLDDRFHTQRIAGLDRHQWSRLSMKLLGSGDVLDHPYQAQFEAFFAAITRGEDMPLTSLREAARSHRVIFAADLSAAQGRTVRVEEIA
jgi:predicted dehydrogenase